ncbi:uncharacterized protein [Euwallacea similis]|uniref:uncharacterized protein isoform X1 n=1 Tax=Euwallacea similis TaxID=1736056 RepID=UPI00344B1709
MAKLNFPLCLAVFGGCYIMCILLNLGYVSAQDDIGPDAEIGETLENFLTELEKYSGLFPLEEADRFLVKDVNCSNLINSECIINVKGTVVWDIRMKLYEKYMAYTPDENTIHTLDGCLDMTSNNISYNDCMTIVRTNMITFLDEDFENEFRTALEHDCNVENNTITEENCINEHNSS